MDDTADAISPCKRQYSREEMKTAAQWLLFQVEEEIKTMQG